MKRNTKFLAGLALGLTLAIVGTVSAITTGTNRTQQALLELFCDACGQPQNVNIRDLAASTVTLLDAQTITGAKTFSGGISGGAEDSVTAFATGGQTSATQLLATVTNHRVSTVVTAADSVKLPAATVGQQHYLRNDGAKPMQVFGQATETINGVASATGVPQAPGVGMWYVCTTAGAWTSTFSNYQPSFSMGTVTTILRNDTGGHGTWGLFALPTGDTATHRFNLGAGGVGDLMVGSTGRIAWSSATTNDFNTQDTGLSRNGAGIVEINNGSAGTFRDLKLRAITSYNNTTTAGLGVPGIVAAGRATAQSAANASISTFTVGAADGSFEVSGNMNVTVVTTLATTLSVSYTDESNAARTMILPIQQLGGTFIAAGAITGLGAWESPVMHIRCKAATAITVFTSAGTFTGVTYTAEGIIKQVS
jgi:hypothetical protein